MKFHVENIFNLSFKIGVFPWRFFEHCKSGAKIQNFVVTTVSSY